MYHHDFSVFKSRSNHLFRIRVFVYHHDFSKFDKINKRGVTRPGITLYCVRGNRGNGVQPPLFKVITFDKLKRWLI